MRKWCTDRVLFGSAIALLGWAIVGLPSLERFWPNDQPASHPTHQTTKQEQERHSPESGLWDWMTHDAAGFFTAWLVIIGGFQLLLFFWQLVLIRKSLDDTKTAAEAAKESADTAKVQSEVANATLSTMQDTAKRQLRAYVLVASADVLENSTNQNFLAEVQFGNFGQTPAHDLVIWRRIELFDNPPTSGADFSLPKEGSPSMVMRPTGVATVDVAKTFSAAEVSEIKNKTKAIFVFGRLEYRDSFEGKQWTDFRLVYWQTPAGREGLMPWDTGNQAS